ncbi:MAG: TrkH family potassium uptake protein [Cetobacterium sp.]|uniref:Trk system potassium uptake protein TrkH n=1 Tax=Cetobacterium ceti TaxID=180163 RepID=A0A1T4JXH2_9FUSO|nr:TrkH family potassium uptake protein [Cetobacterium ceti]MCJ8342117.1 TrkH family potassium uptake protein [Cetobacterium sp.]SJZ34871.1 trk system potassium uptake protein TrkH [Cetobacterium ceti]
MSFNYLKKLSPSRKLIVGFFLAIILGSILLMMPFSLNDGQHISFLTSLFTITSAVCVTGLSVIDVSQVLSTYGQIVLLIFIQLGGLGVMTFSSLIFLMIGKKISYHERELLKEERNAESNGEIISFIKGLVATVFIIESIGAFFLTLEFMKEFPLEKAIYYGIFHSISAFCNAGFALFSNNLENYAHNFGINMTISYLIIIGGIGFSVINSVLMAVRKNVKRFTLTSKVGILISIILTFGGTILFMLLEYNNPGTIGHMGFFDKLLASFFQSVTTRTAGFNTVPMGNLTKGSIFMFCILMFIGACPGSTGGGIKTTTLGVMMFYVAGVVKGRENIEIFNRRIDWEILNRALAILVISIMYISIIIMLMMMVEHFKFEEIVFEVISAFGTVGLSLGITAKLSIFSKILIIITMFIGRLGPLTFALALGENKIKENVKYPKENILVG